MMSKYRKESDEKHIPLSSLYISATTSFCRNFSPQIQMYRDGTQETQTAYFPYLQLAMFSSWTSSILPLQPMYIYAFLFIWLHGLPL